jgi:hypothetical protein
VAASAIPNRRIVRHRGSLLNLMVPGLLRKILEDRTMIRRLGAVCAPALALSSIATVALAQTYPARPIRVIVTTSPGGLGGILRALAGLHARLGRPLVIENRPGGNMVIGARLRERPPTATRSA